MLSRRTFIGMGLVAAGGAAVAASTVTSNYVAMISAAHARVSQGSQTIETRFGTLEYGVAGDGPPVLVIHGTGGGFDQGIGFTTRLAKAGRRVIAPSRFGYLRSDFPQDAGSAAQADAFVELLDALGIDELPVAGGSAGALSAIEFAIRHPDRCSALVAIVPATYAPKRSAIAPMSWLQERAMRAMLGSDFLFWSATRLLRDEMIGTMLATDPVLVARASAEEQTRVSRMLEGILPVSSRSRGLMNDAVLAADPAPQALDMIAVPTLAISVEDDRFGTADAARYLASRIGGARLVLYPTGGHLWVGHDEALFAEIDAFLKAL